MAKEEIGFKHGVPENPDKTWTAKVNGVAFTFTKSRDKAGFFLYRCERHGKSSGFKGTVDLPPEQVEKLQQFASFIGFTPGSPTLSPISGAKLAGFSRNCLSLSESKPLKTNGLLLFRVNTYTDSLGGGALLGNNYAD